MKARRKEPIWIEERDALAIHDRLLGRDGGAPGLRDSALLQSALARPRQYYAYDSSADTIKMAALYTAGIVHNHPFVDGNKRTGFVIGILFLELNRFAFTATEADATQAVFDLAAGAINEAAYAAWLRTGSRRKPRR